MKHVVVGTAGHIDHGKSALVRALTGIDPDRLKEEKDRGITIDLGFAYLPDEGGLSLGFVDVPGHERFVKNMLAGVGGIDLVLLVVAADESVMPQTREHFEICRLLRIPRGLIVITKCDLAEPDLREIAALEVRELVTGSFLDDAPVLEVSARTGEGLDVLKETLMRLARGIPPRSQGGLFRLPVDRVFSMKGFGTVATGTLIAGSVGQDSEVEILPRGVRARVRGLQVHGHKHEAAVAGQRTAVNLQGVEVSDLMRGDVLASPERFEATSMLDCRLEVLSSSPIVVKDLTRVHLHLGTASVRARVRLFQDRKSIAPGESAFTQLRLEAPIVAARGDRFIIRRYSPLVTIGGGLVLDAHPRKRSASSSPALPHFETLLEGEPWQVAALFVSEAGVSGTTEKELGRRLAIDSSELAPVLEKLLSSQKAIEVAKRLFVAPEVASSLASEVEGQLRLFHKKNPLLAGMPKSELREKTARPAPPEVFEAILARLSSGGRLRIAKELVAAAEHQISLNPEEEKARETLIARYRSAGNRPESLAEMAASEKLDPKLLERVQRVLLKNGTLVQIGDGLVFHREALEKLKATVRGLKSKRDRIDVAVFKEIAGVTRKHAIPLLEWLDRERVTARAGNDRLIL